MYSACMLPLELTPEALANLRKESEARNIVLLDVREPWEVQVAHLDGTVNMPMGDIPSRAHAELDPEQRIITICHHGIRSLQVANWLRNQGFDEAQSLSGGLDAWSREIDPSMPRY